MKWWKQSWFGKALMTAAMMTPQIVSMPLAFYLYGQGEIGIETLLLSLILPIAPGRYVFTVKGKGNYKGSVVRVLLIIRIYGR